MTEDTFNKILEVSKRLFVKKGYTATSIREIAEETGIGKSTIYHHFKDKKEIILELLKINKPDISNLIKEVNDISDPKEKIRYAIVTSYGSFVKSSDILQIIRREIPEGKKYFQENFKKFLSDYIKLISDALKEGINKGIFRKIEHDIAAKAIVTLLQGTIASSYLTEGTLMPQNDLIQVILDMLYQGILKK